MIRILQRAALAVAVTVSAGAAHAACDTAPLIEQCKGKLGDGYNVTSTFALDGQDGKVTSITDDNVLTSRLSYQVAVCSQDGDIDFALQTGAGEEVMTNKSGGQSEQVITIKAERMGVYNLVFSVQPPAALCGGAVLGAKK